jgi:hypothetical protein
MSTRMTRARLAGVAALTTLAGALLAGGAPAGAAVSDPTEKTVAFDALLQADDVPGYGSVFGIETISADDLPAFARNGGIREVTQRWYQEAPASLIFDFRFQFPDARSARRFLDASEADLGEVHNGSQPMDPPVAPLRDTRFYRYEDRVLGTGAVGHNFLMRHENLVAKVYVSGSADGVTPGDAARVASAAAARMITALGGEAPVQPTPEPGGDLSPLEELRSHVPSAVEGCLPSFAIDPQSQETGVTASLECDHSATQSLMFQLFDSVQGMDALYDIYREAALGLRQGSGEGSCAEGDHDGVWLLDGEEAGRLLCATMEEGSIIFWSHPDTRILSSIIQVDADTQAAHQLWLIAGPE